MPFIETDIQTAMKRLKLAMAAEEDGKKLKRDIAKHLRKIANPLVQKQRAAVRALPSKGHSGQSLRQAVARQTRVATRWGGRDVGISVIQRARAMPREFNMAGRAFNREEGWNPVTLGGETVHQQAVPTGWFDNNTEGVKPDATREVQAAIAEMADRIASRVR